MNKNFKIWDTFSLAWRDLKKEWKFILLAFLTFIFIGMIDGAFGYGQNPITHQMEGSGLVTIIINLITIYLSGGFILETLKIVDGKKPSWKRLFTWAKSLSKGGRFIVGYVLYSILIFVPIAVTALLFLITSKGSLIGSKAFLIGIIISGIITIIFSIFISPAFYLLAEDRNNIFKNISKSFSMVSKKFEKVFGWYAYTIGIVILITILIYAIVSSIILILANSGGSPTGSIMAVAGIGVILLFPAIILFSGWVSIAFGHLYRNIDPEVQKNIEVVEEGEEA